MSLLLPVTQSDRCNVYLCATPIRSFLGLSLAKSEIRGKHSQVRRAKNATINVSVFDEFDVIVYHAKDINRALTFKGDIDVDKINSLYAEIPKKIFSFRVRSYTGLWLPN